MDISVNLIFGIKYTFDFLKYDLDHSEHWFQSVFINKIQLVFLTWWKSMLKLSVLLCLSKLLCLFSEGVCEENSIFT